MLPSYPATLFVGIANTWMVIPLPLVNPLIPVSVCAALALFNAIAVVPTYSPSVGSA